MSFERALELATALQAYSVRSKSDKTSDVNRLIQEANLRKTSFDTIFPAMFSLHGLDIKDALEKAVKDKDITPNAAEVAIIAINNAMHDIANRYPVLDESTFKQLDFLLQDFVNEFNYGQGSLSKDTAKRMEAILDSVKALFKQPYVVTYFEGDKYRVASIKVAHNSFKNLRDIINTRIKEAVNAELTAKNITNSKLRDSTLLTTKIINWGHTQTNDSIISGKILAEMMSARNVLSTTGGNNDAFKLIVKDFLEETGQANTVIKIHHGELTKGDPNVLQLVIKSGIFQTAIVQNRRENQEDLGQLEKKWSLADAVGRQNLLKVFGVNSIQGLGNLLLRVRSSPNVIEKIKDVLVSTANGKIPEKTAKVINLLNSKEKIQKRRKKITVSKNNEGANQPLNRDSKVSNFGTAASQVNLTSLLNLINMDLTEQIRRNMGSGTRRDVLNYRTGRFAESVKVEKMSQSRQGMITAFYSYMKNPYATFSEGGAQQFPRSRDPKLLISKSIRDLMTTQVANKLRAVSV